MALTHRPWYRSLPLFVRGDVDAFVYVFSNNLSTMLVGAQVVQQFVGENKLYNSILPGIGVSMLFGCLFYIVQAMWVASRDGRHDLCSQPFGINTPGMFAFNTSVILAVYTANGGGKNPGSPEEEHAQDLAWRVGVIANFVQGCIEILLSFVGPWIPKVVPQVTLLGSLASVGFAFLFTGTFLSVAFKPLVGLISFYLLIMALHADVRVPKLPASFVPVALGAAMAWITGFATADQVTAAKDTLGWHPCRFAFKAFENFGEVMPYVGVVVPVALTVSVGTIQCQQFAATAGDVYDVQMSMLGDGLATVVAALFGSPYGMTVFLGHSSLKAMGAKVGYNMMTGLAMLAVCFSGFAAMLLAIIPAAALSSILLFVGLGISSDTLAGTPPRHYVAFVLGLMPATCNWAVSMVESFGRMLCANVQGGQCQLQPDSLAAWTHAPDLRGLYAMGQGYLLAGIYLASMLIFVIDKHFLEAGAWAALAALCSSCGLIHSDTLFWPWEGPPGPPPGADEKRFDLHIEFAVAYAILAVIFFGVDIVGHRIFEKVPRGPLDRRPADAPLTQGGATASWIASCPSGSAPSGPSPLMNSHSLSAEIDSGLMSSPS